MVGNAAFVQMYKYVQFEALPEVGVPEGSGISPIHLHLSSPKYVVT